MTGARTRATALAVVAAAVAAAGVAVVPAGVARADLCHMAINHSVRFGPGGCINPVWNSGVGRRGGPPMRVGDANWPPAGGSNWPPGG